MTKFIVLFMLSALSAVFLGPIIPFWALMLMIAVLAALIGGNGWAAFFSSALAVGAVWLLVPLFIIFNTGSDLPGKMAQIMGFSSGMPIYVLTSLSGFLLAGFGALTGNCFRRLF